jgi:general secretion pathway protein G
VPVPPEDPQKGGVFDVKSGAQGKAIDGTEFANW